MWTLQGLGRGLSLSGNCRNARTQQSIPALHQVLVQVFGKGQLHRCRTTVLRKSRCRELHGYSLGGETVGPKFLLHVVRILPLPLFALEFRELQRSVRVGVLCASQPSAFQPSCEQWDGSVYR
jgi:hypothetical protein